ncbi:PILR alpha-associated neural protein isoform X2 [Syngnathoides biaculeatus]|uniref:PILR alpha-associated neural protein isoform X2 n=1 Tax=Syngnathoides biaculeatus TaxID=300417 RepID=UPI002ADE4F42|nr:PILR alpha-associated neural protein isoform X2 [Syngnathoides biaculeatus]
MERCSIAPVARLTALISLVLVALVTQPSTCHRDDEAEGQVDALSAQLSVTTQETEHLHQHGSQREPSTTVAISSEDWLYPDAVTHPEENAPPELWNREGVEDGGAKEAELEEVDPQFYVTVTISSLLILTAIIITAKLCYDRNCSRHPPPLSRGVAPPLSRALPCSLASEESRQTLHSTSSSFADRERIPVVNL